MSNLVAALERIADALEELVEQGKFDPVQAAIDEANNYTDLI